MIKYCIGLAIAAVPTIAVAASFEAARATYDHNKVAEAERLYAEIVADGRASAEDRARASIELARIAWLIDANADAALGHAEAALATGAKACDAATMVARILGEARRLEQLGSQYASLIARCSDTTGADSITLRMVRGHLDRAHLEPERRATELTAAKAAIDRLGIDAAASLEAASARVELGLLSADAEIVARGWRDYYWLTSDAGPPALERYQPFARIRSGLAPDASDDSRVALAYVLMRAGFAEAALRFARQHNLPGSSTSREWRLLQAYWAARDEIIETERRVNRALARGGSRNDPTLEQAARRGMGALMAAAGASGDPRQALLEHYGLVGSVGETSGYPSMHAGHAVDVRTEIVSQYGQSATVRFVAIDNMWANGFESWLWDGHAAAGGWAADGTIIQVRPAYTNAPTTALRLVGPTNDRRELEAQIPRLSNQDLASAQGRIRGNLDGLAARLRIQVVDQIERASRAKGGNFRHAFLDEYWRASLQQSIIVHEGRHAIDQASRGSHGNETMEYNAKLSELVFSDYPRLALRNMSRGLGGSTPHNRAGTRIFDQLASWIDRNRGQVAGYDPALPAAVQLDKLTDGQIREIARSLDPLARPQDFSR